MTEILLSDTDTLPGVDREDIQEMYLLYTGWYSSDPLQAVSEAMKLLKSSAKDKGADGVIRVTEQLIPGGFGNTGVYAMFRGMAVKIIEQDML